MTIKLLFILTALLFLSQLNSFSQSKIIVKGQILRECKPNIPIDSATIKIYSTDGSTYEVFSSTDGYFECNLFPKDKNTSYVIVAGKINDDSNESFLKSSKKITIPNSKYDTIITIDFELKYINSPIRLPYLIFDHNSHILNKSQLDSLSFMYRILEENPNITIKVLGNSNFTETNRDSLSLNRAISIKKALIDFGANPSRISTGIEYVDTLTFYNCCDYIISLYCEEIIKEKDLKFPITIDKSSIERIKNEELKNHLINHLGITTFKVTRTDFKE